MVSLDSCWCNSANRSKHFKITLYIPSYCTPEEEKNASEAHINRKVQQFYPNGSMTTKHKHKIKESRSPQPVRQRGRTLTICFGAAIFGKGGYQVHKAVYLFELYSVHVDICFAISDCHHFALVNAGLHSTFVQSVSFLIKSSVLCWCMVSDITHALPHKLLPIDPLFPVSHSLPNV